MMNGVRYTIKTERRLPKLTVALLGVTDNEMAVI